MEFWYLNLTVSKKMFATSIIGHRSKTIEVCLLQYFTFLIFR